MKKDIIDGLYPLVRALPPICVVISGLAVITQIWSNLALPVPPLAFSCGVAAMPLLLLVTRWLLEVTNPEVVQLRAARSMSPFKWGFSIEFALIRRAPRWMKLGYVAVFVYGLIVMLPLITILFDELRHDVVFRFVGAWTLVMSYSVGVIAYSRLRELDEERATGI